MCARTRAALVWMEEKSNKSHVSAPDDFDRDTRGAGGAVSKQHCCEV